MPHFDSPSVFARILDKDKVLFCLLATLVHSLLGESVLSDSRVQPLQGGHFSICPRIPFSTKQNYLPSSNVRTVSSLVAPLAKLMN